MSALAKGFWDAAADRDPFNRVRTGWTATDFDRRTDESICCELEFKPDDIVLDYGCGPGYACKMVAPKVRRYVGLDYSEAMIEMARQRNARFDNVTFVVADGVSIPAPDAAFDCVFCELVFQHNDRHTTLKVLDEIKRVLKPDGRASLQFPTKHYGPEVGFTAAELSQACPGWRVRPSGKHYVYCER